MIFKYAFNDMCSINTAHCRLCSKSHHSAEYGSSNTCQLGTYKIMYTNKSKQFLLIFDHLSAHDNS